MVGTLFLLGLALFILGTLRCMHHANERGSSLLLFLLPFAGFMSSDPAKKALAPQGVSRRP